MKIIEQYINSKNGDMSACEDGILVTPNFVCLVDGATAKSKMLWNGKKAGYVAKQICLQTVSEFDKNIDGKQAILTLTQALKNNYGDQFEHFVANPHDQTEASILIYSKAKDEVWVYGDCQLVIDGVLHSHDKEIDHIIASARVVYDVFLLESGKATMQELKQKDLGREYIETLIAMQPALANKKGEFGYPVLNGVSVDTDLLTTYKVPKGSTVVLASDGYPFLKQTLQESEQALAHVLENDPFLIHLYRATKGLMEGNISYDDRSYIKFIAE